MLSLNKYKNYHGRIAWGGWGKKALDNNYNTIFQTRLEPPYRRPFLLIDMENIYTIYAVIAVKAVSYGK